MSFDPVLSLHLAVSFDQIVLSDLVLSFDPIVLSLHLVVSFDPVDVLEREDELHDRCQQCSDDG